MPSQTEHPLAKAKILQATIDTILADGLKSVTHQSVSRRAGVSLASTTYHYKHKEDFILEAARVILERPIVRLKTVRDAVHHAPVKPRFGDLSFGILGAALGAYWWETLAVREILVYMSRQQQLTHLCALWYRDQTEVWSEILQDCRDVPADLSVRSALDFMLGVETLLQSIGMGQDALPLLIHGMGDFVFHPAKPLAGAQQSLPARDTKKSNNTRGRVLAAAQRILISGGAAAMTHKAVAEKAKLAVSVPTYHFASKSQLLSETFRSLAIATKNRYGRVMSEVDYKRLDLTDVVALTDLIIQQETTRFAKENLAIEEIKIWAGRDTSLQPILWDLFSNHAQGWSRLFETLGLEVSQKSTLLIGCITSGKITRLIQTGNKITDLITIRRDLEAELGALLNGKHWIQSGEPSSMPQNLLNAH